MKILLLLCFFLLSLPLDAADKPNFLWLISEDNSVHYLDLFDPNGTRTPNIEKLAKNGVIFERAFSNSPVCSVARTTLITSCYGPRIGTQYHRRSAMAPMPEGLKMWPQLLRESGYYTVNNNKTDYNATPGKEVWDMNSTKGHWRKRKAGQPFLHKQSFKTTHESSLHFKDLKKPTNHDPASVFVQPYFPNTETFRYTAARYRDNIQTVDAQMGKLVDQLESDGLLEDTFIFYFGDHGGVMPRGKGYAYESGLHVPLVVRIPKNFAHLVDANAGSRSKDFVSFVDLGPTVLHLAGLDIPGQVDGKPILGKQLAAEVAARDTAFGYADRFDEKYDLVRTFRKGRFKYMRNFQPFNFDSLQNNYRYRQLAYTEWRDLYEAGELNEVQSAFHRPRAPEALYDLDADPHETVNLAGHPEHAEMLGELRLSLHTHMKDIADLSMIPEHVMVRDAMKNPVAYGKRHKAKIAGYIDTANLSLGSFEEAKDGIATALAADDPWQRYWGLIVCSCFGKQAKPFAGTAQKLAASDAEGMVRTRAAEFLGLAGFEDPAPVILDVLAKSEDDVETLLVFNSLVLLRDGEPGYTFEVDPKKVKSKGGEVERRLEYLAK